MGSKSDYNKNHGGRLLHINERLNKGELLVKATLAQEYNVSEKTIQRDIDDLRAYFAETHVAETETYVKYDKRRGGYYLVYFEREWLASQEVLALSKILLESRAFKRSELKTLLDKLFMQIMPGDKKIIEEIIRSEYHNYVPLKHDKALLSPLWALSGYIKEQEHIRFSYTRKDGLSKEHHVKPVSIMFSEFYFYLVCFMADDSKPFPTIFRVDRMADIKGTKEKFRIPYADKFNDGEFRKRVQFMFSGALNHVSFTYSGQSIESVLDRLPTAEILSHEDGVYSLRVEAYGDGIQMWLRSQGDNVKLL